MQDPRAGEPEWDSELSLLWENLCHIIILQFVGRPAGGYGIYYIATPLLLPVSLWFLPYVFSCRSFSGRLQSLSLMVIVRLDFDLDHSF